MAKSRFSRRHFDAGGSLASIAEKKPDSVAHLGQVFTPQRVVQTMFGLIQNRGRILEPASGDGAFLRYGMDCGASVTAIEIDHALARKTKACHADFFTYPVRHKYNTIIGNPPYVRFQDILPATKALLPDYFDERTNLYIFFIDKCIRHLRARGELILITPRDFLKATCAHKLNETLYTDGSFTHFSELGDQQVFQGYSPNCAIWRWEKGRQSRRLDKHRSFCYANGQIWFGQQTAGRLGDFFAVKVGAVSGADHIFTDSKRGCTNFVCSKTATTGDTRRMIYNRYDEKLEPYKETLLSRRIRRFDESNWWAWGRTYPHREGERIYVNSKTRNAKPFFISDKPAFDGSVLGLFPKEGVDLGVAVKKLNATNWGDLGFACDGRLLFTQKSLENAPLDVI